MKFFVLAFFVFSVLFCGTSYASDPNHDPRPLTEEEVKTFLPLVCRDARKPTMEEFSPYLDPSGYVCSEFINFPGKPYALFMTPTSILYGTFSQKSAEEAFLTVSTDPGRSGTYHGEGALFRRENGKWKLTGWSKNGGLEFNECFAFPNGDRQYIACREDYAFSMGMVGTNFYVQGITDKTKGDMSKMVIFGVQDLYPFEEPELASKFCKSYSSHQGKNLIAGIGSLRPSIGPEYFADLVLSYLTPKDIKRTCKKKGSSFNELKPLEKTAIVHLMLSKDSIEMVPPFDLYDWYTNCGTLDEDSCSVDIEPLKKVVPIK